MILQLVRASLSCGFRQFLTNSYLFLPKDISSIQLSGSFSFDFDEICLDEKSIFISKDSKICITNKQGVVKQIVNVESNMYGSVLKMDRRGDYLLVLTSFLFILTFDAARREIKSPIDVKNLGEYGYDDISKAGNDILGRFVAVTGAYKGIPYN